MATSKKTSPKTNEGATYDKEFADKLIKESYERGLSTGKQEAFTTLATFLQQRMTIYFENRKDDIAKEYRDILLLIRQNIK